MKRITGILLSVLFVFMSFDAGAAEVFYEDGYALYESEDAAAVSTPEAAISEDMPVAVRAKAAVLMDADSGIVLAHYNRDEKLYPASVTKIMAMLLVAEAIDDGTVKLTDEVTASTNASSKGGSQIWLKEGETMTVDELLKATAIYSANDACTALGELIAGSSEAFVDMMNKRAEELSMNNTNFVNCTGLDDDTTEHLTTALDVAIMSRELLKHEFIMNYTTVWMDSLRNGETELVNTNKLVRFYEGTTGLKTGTTNKAGCCISASAKRGDTHLIAVIMGSSNSKDRFEGAKALLNWGFSNYETVKPKIDGSKITQVNVIKGEKESFMPQIPQTLSVLIPKGEYDKIEQEVNVSVDVEAPVEKGQTVGNVVLRLNGEILGSYSLTAPEEVKKLTLTDIFKRMISVFAK
ncbi:MAG: D-alanyl-D-alanine carboxypeptidase [Clostridia bacterium]|nr:D-alanyl-D-alanine carboxypeptidase [Clostridia bacterium]